MKLFLLPLVTSSKSRFLIAHYYHYFVEKCFFFFFFFFSFFFFSFWARRKKEQCSSLRTARKQQSRVLWLKPLDCSFQPVLKRLHCSFFCGTRKKEKEKEKKRKTKRKKKEQCSRLRTGCNEQSSGLSLKTRGCSFRAVLKPLHCSFFFSFFFSFLFFFFFLFLFLCFWGREKRAM